MLPDKDTNTLPIPLTSNKKILNWYGISAGLSSLSKTNLMKKTLTLFIAVASLCAKAQLPSTELLKAATFAGLTNEVKTGYGTTADDPIPSGAFMNITDKGNTQMLKLKNSYRWPTGESLDFSKRFSTRGKTGIVDCYTLVRTGSTDTVRLFVDPYHVATQYFVPAGLTAVTRERLAVELAPYVKQTETLMASPDATLLTETYDQLASYLITHFGTTPFLDPEMIKDVALDEEADKKLRNFLIGSYVTGKFYAQAKDMADPKQYACNYMKSSFKKYIPLYPETKTGILKTTLQ